MKTNTINETHVPTSRELGDRCRVVPSGEKTRTWTGWYRHYKVTIDGAELQGLIQVKFVRRSTKPFRLPARTEVLTSVGGFCVGGRDVDWLIRRNVELGTLKGGAHGRD